MRGGAAVLHKDEEDTVQDQHGGDRDVIVEAGLKPVVQRADDEHRDGGGHHLEPELPDGRFGADAAMAQAEGPELIPEQHHHSQNGTQLDDHAEHGHEFLAGVELDHLLHQDHVAGGRDGQPLGDALHNAHQDGFQYFKKHGFSSLQSGTGALHTFRLGSLSSISYSESLRTKNHKFYTGALSAFSVFICRRKYAILDTTFFPVFPSDTDCRARQQQILNNEVTSMNILVIGCDQVGAALVRDLERIGHDISLIEKDPEQLKRLDSFDDYSFGGTALVGDPTDPDILKQGGVENCDAVAAVCEDDSVNLMAAQIAKNIFRREKVICRVSDPHLQVLYHKTYELDTICPTILTEQAVFRALAK